MSHERVSARRRLPGQLGPPTDPDAACGLNHSSIRGLLLSPLLLLVALVTVLTAGTVSAAAAHGSETRVRAFDTPTANAVGQPSSESAGHVGCLRPVQPGFVSGSCVATESEYVNLASESRTSHILDGEVRPNGTYGGGHRPGTGFPNKSEFPAGWSDDQIMHNISDVATDPALPWTPGDRPGDFLVNGTRSDVDSEVLIRNDQIWTGYPTSLPRNPR
jgi:hypothetical protein